METVDSIFAVVMLIILLLLIVYYSIMWTVLPKLDRIIKLLENQKKR